MNKKNKLIVAKGAVNSQVIQPDGTEVNTVSTELNEEQQQKYTSNQQELEQINKAITTLQKRNDEFKKEQKTLQQRIKLQKSEQNDQDQQRIKEASMQKLANGRLSKENQQDYDLYMQQRLQFQQQPQSNDPQRVFLRYNERTAVYAQRTTATTTKTS